MNNLYNRAARHPSLSYELEMSNNRSARKCSKFEQRFGLWNPNSPTYAAWWCHKLWKIRWKPTWRWCGLRLRSSGGVTGEFMLKTRLKPRKPALIFRGAPTLNLMCPHHAPPTSETRVCSSSEKILEGIGAGFSIFGPEGVLNWGWKWSRSKNSANS